MTDIITAADLASWLRDDSLATNASLIQIVDLTNEVVTEAWAAPVDPVPANVKLIALSVAARAWVNNPATSNQESITVTVDDGSTTRRLREPSRAGVYLTSDETAALNGQRRARSVRLVAYGDVS